MDQDLLGAYPSEAPNGVQLRNLLVSPANIADKTVFDKTR